jgi:hypothetical protein
MLLNDAYLNWKQAFLEYVVYGSCKMCNLEFLNIFKDILQQILPISPFTTTYIDAWKVINIHD